MKITALLSALNSALAEPFALAWVSDSPRFLLVFTVIYAVVVIVAVTDQKNTRPGAEHGSAAWGDVFRLNKFYMDRHGSNLLLTQHFHIGIDGYKHKHTIWTRMDSVSRMGKAAGKIIVRIQPIGTIKEMWRFGGQRGQPTPTGRWNLPVDRSALTTAATSGRALIKSHLSIWGQPPAKWKSAVSAPTREK